MIPVLHGVWAAAGGLVGDFEHIETVTVGSGGAASITFSSIASTYKHLQIRGIVRTAQAGPDETRIRVNSDTGSNYSAHQLIGNGSSAASYGASSQTFIKIGPTSDSGTTANIFGTMVVDLLDYTSTSKNKTIRSLTGLDTNGGGSIWLSSGAWLSTSAVTSLTISLVVGANLAQNSSLSLYGVK